MDKISELKEELANEYSCYDNVFYGSGEFDYRVKHFKAGFDTAMELQLPVQNKLINALRHLVVLKKVKDKYGKTETYLDQQPKAWEYAIEVLNEIIPEDKIIV